MINFSEMTSHLPQNPLRAPDWRWKLAGFLCEYAISPRLVCNDDYLIGALELYQESMAARPVISSIQFYVRNTDALTAWNLYTNDDLIAAEIQARILASQSEQEIANKIGISPKALHLYEKYFFDVRDRLNNSSWIQHYVIGEVKIADKRSMWKLFGYWAGPDILDLLIYNINLPRFRRLSPEEVLRECVERFKFRLLTYMSQLPMSEELCWEALKRYIAISLDRKEASDSDTKEIQEFVKAIQQITEEKSNSHSGPAPILIEASSVDRRLNPILAEKGIDLTGAEFPQSKDDPSL